MGISWGRSERFTFTPGGQLAKWVAPTVAAVYSITFKQDPRNKPKSHTVLYFGEAADLSVEAPSVSEVLNEVPDSSIGPGDLFVFIHPMPGSTRYERAKILQTLIGDYRPPGNGY